MDATQVEAIVQLLSSGGLLAAVIIVIVAGYKGFWTWGWQLAEMREDRNFWRNMRLKEIDVAERIMSTAPPETHK